MNLKNNAIQPLVFVLVVLFSLMLTQPKKNDFQKNDIIDKNILSSSLIINAAPAKESTLSLPFNFEGQSALARELNGETIFYELNSKQRWPIASLTKLMTSVIALEKIEKNDQTENLIKAMMLISDNDAANRLANIFGYDNFIKAMNQKAKELSMDQTSFFDPSGLSFLNQSTTNNLYKLVRYISIYRPQILQWSREKELNIDGLKYVNINKFVERADFLGGKTGWTDEASGNLISVFSSPKKPILIIALGTANKIERFEQTKNLLEWIFQYYRL